MSTVEIADRTLVDVEDSDGKPLHLPGRLSREAIAAKSLRESLAAVDPDDETLLLDTIEGETGLLEIVDALLQRMQDNQIMVTGISAAQAALAERGERYEKRISSDRALLEQAMLTAELFKIERPLATLSLSNRALKVEVMTEADIPADYWEAGAPKLDKKAVLDALKAGRTVPGACLSNTAPSLTVRTR